MFSPDEIIDVWIVITSYGDYEKPEIKFYDPKLLSDKIKATLLTSPYGEDCMELSERMGNEEGEYWKCMISDALVDPSEPIRIVHQVYLTCF